MKFTGFEVLDATVQRTNAWLKELMLELNWSDRRKTYTAFRCIVHVLRDHLSIKDAIALGDELPMLIRGMYFEHWDPSGDSLQLRSRDEFISYLSASLARNGLSGISAEMVTRAFFRLLDRKATEGEIADLQLILPADLIDLWSPALRAA